MIKPVLIVCFGLLTGGLGYYIGSNKSDSSFSLLEGEHSCSVLFQLAASDNVLANDSRMMTRHFLKNQIDLIQSEENISTAITNYNLDKLYKSEINQLKEEIKSSLRVQTEKDTDLLRVQVVSNSEDKAQQISYALIQGYTSQIRAIAQKKSNERLLKIDTIIEAQDQKVQALAAEFNNSSRRFSLKRKPETPAPTSDEKIQFGIQRNEYEKESSILDAMQVLKVRENLFTAPSEPIIYHMSECSDKNVQMMENRKNAQPIR